jgi:ubiquinol-cytochrome c reductase cytochrome b subunit
MQSFLNWLDDRTGIRDFLAEALYESIPGGARWRYVWGSTLVFTFFVQLVTGVFLWMQYSPSAQTAWESVYYIQYQTDGGWLLRGVHHFTAQAMVVLLVFHMLQVVIDGAYRAPREVNFWLGLILMQIVLGLSLTGYLLPWDQKGFWATAVATNLMNLVPVVGDYLQKLVVGGPEYGHHTLTRFFALHAGVLPGLLIFFLVLHVYMFRRHGITHKLPAKYIDGTFWPDQVLKDAVACLAVMAVVLLFVVRGALFSGETDVTKLGAELGAPADPTVPFDARPEWYFLFLFKFLQFFRGESERIGAIYVPGLVMALLFLMPIVGRWKLGHRFNVALIFALLVGAGFLTYVAWSDDRYGEKAIAYQEQVRKSNLVAERVIDLANSPSGIPRAGALTLMRNDPQIRGLQEFDNRCAVCHGKPAEKDKDGNLMRGGAPSLVGFANRKWIAGLLNPEKIAGPEYFGNTAHFEGDMVTFVHDDLKTWKPEEIENVVIALSAEAKLESQAKLDEADAARIAAGRELITDTAKCAQCHKFHDVDEGGGAAPDLTGYGSKEWLAAFIHNPADPRFYGDRNDRMPAFGTGGPEMRLKPESIKEIIDFIRSDWNQTTE